MFLIFSTIDLSHIDACIVDYIDDPYRQLIVQF
jgi:hypothetical protein